MVDKLRKGFKSGKTRERSYRIDQLKQLFKMLDEKEDKLLEAVYNDLRKVSSNKLMLYVPSLNCTTGKEATRIRTHH